MKPETKNDASRLTIKNETSQFSFTVTGEAKFSDHEIRTLLDFIKAAQALRRRLAEGENKK